jgi:hypothetical protein
MNQAAKLKVLRVFLTVYGILSIVLFGGLFLLTATDASVLQDGGALRFMRWDVLSKHVELMIEAIYFVWGVFLLLAARRPLSHLSFLDFTAWANLAHGLVMVPQALMLKGFEFKLATDVAYCLVLALGLWLLRPRGREVPKSSQGIEEV